MKRKLKSIKVEEDTKHIIWVIAKSNKQHQYEYIRKLVAEDLKKYPTILSYAERMGIEL